MKYFVTVLLLIVLVPSAAFACWDYLEYSYAEFAYNGTDPVTLMVTPDRTGPPLTAASEQYGNLVDATITFYLNDCAGIPIAGFPAEDMWLESVDGGLAMCTGGSTADTHTNAAGIATWTRPLAGGGSSQAGCMIMVSGMVLPSSPITLWFNSPDITGDGLVNLTDVPLFAADFYGGVYMHRSDLSPDGFVNLSDVVRLAVSLGSSCP